jgi:hypothetical protein
MIALRIAMYMTGYDLKGVSLHFRLAPGKDDREATEKG